MSKTLDLTKMKMFVDGVETVPLKAEDFSPPCLSCRAVFWIKVPDNGSGLCPGCEELEELKNGQD